MPQRPYIPLGSLRTVLAYPVAPEHFSDDACRAALRRVELGELIEALDRDRRWDKELTMDEQQRLAGESQTTRAHQCT